MRALDWAREWLTNAGAAVVDRAEEDEAVGGRLNRVEQTGVGHVRLDHSLQFRRQGFSWLTTQVPESLARSAATHVHPDPLGPRALANEVDPCLLADPALAAVARDQVLAAKSMRLTSAIGAQLDERARVLTT